MPIQILSKFLKKNIESDYYAILGHPVSQSLSPLMHTIALQYHGIKADFIRIDVDNAANLGKLFESKYFKGASVTIPLKEEVIKYLTHTDVKAMNLRAVNCVCKKGNIIKGYNTDISGFMYPLKSFQDIISGKSAIVFGNGGASRAVVKGLEELGATKIWKVSRIKTSEDLIDYHQWTDYSKEVSVIVNATPLGMEPDIESSPVKNSEIHHLSGKLCYDVVYKPLKTKFLKQAEIAGAVTINGFEMFLRQGEEAFKIWTGFEFPYQEVKKALLNA